MEEGPKVRVTGIIGCTPVLTEQGKGSVNNQGVSVEVTGTGATSVKGPGGSRTDFAPCIGQIDTRVGGVGIHLTRQ